MKFMIVFLIFSLLTIPIFSQDLTAEQERELNRLRLFVETDQHTFGSFNIDTGFWYSSTVKQWKGYRGFSLINEDDFYRIAGYDFEANQAQKYKSVNNILLISGGTVTVIGFGMMITSLLTMPDVMDPDFDAKMSTSETLLWVGAGVGIAGAIPLGIGISRALRNWGPAGSAFQIADDYNAELKKRIRSK